LSQRTLLIASIAAMAAGFLLTAVVGPLVGQSAPAADRPGLQQGPGSTFGPGFPGHRVPGAGPFGRMPHRVPQPSPTASPSL
jgi:hypothetical protein